MQLSYQRASAQTTMLNQLSRPSRPFARVSAIIPTMNEAANLPHVFSRLPFEELFEVIIVDGHSSDDTVEVARELMPSVRVVLQDGKGKGNALACGFAAARGDIIVMLDADGSTDPAEIPAFLDALFAGADFAKGSRFMAGGDSADITPLRRAGNRFLNGIVNILYGTVTPTSATATTPSGPTCCPRSTSIATGSRSRR